MGDENGQSQTDEKSSVEAKETTRKIIRVITVKWSKISVIAYLCSVSMAAIMLSLYYLFFWNPTIRVGPERLVDQMQLPLRQFHAKTSGESMNETYPNLEREEPRALPVQDFEESFHQTEEEVDGTLSNFSLFSLNENKTILNKIIKLLKTQ